MSIAIINAGGGGSLGLSVAAYANTGSLPASGVAGDIAVITSDAIGTAYAGAVAPTSPATGDLWVWTGGAALVTIPLTDQIRLSPRAVYRWSGSVWVLLVSYVYSGSAWVQVSLYAYDDGVEVLSTFSIGNRSRTNNTLTKYATNMVMFREFGGGATSVISVMSDVALDLTDITTLKIKYTRTGLTTGTTSLVVANSRGTYVWVASSAMAVATEAIVSVNVASLNGLYYVGLYSDGPSSESAPGVTVTVKEIWLEK